MNIVVIGKKPVRTAECGLLPVDTPVRVSDPLGKFLIEQGLAALVETKSIPAPIIEPAPKPAKKK